MKLLAKVGSLALIAAVAGGVVAGCSSNDVAKQGAAKGGEGQTGTIGLSLQPVSGVTLSSIHYVVTKTGSMTPVSEGNLPTPGTAKTFSFGLPLPVGTGYTVSLTGTSDENANVTCVGSSPAFDVTSNTSAQINLVLTCSDATLGGVKGGVTVTTDLCPHLIIDYVVATPSSANVPGGTIALLSSARDTDGKTVTYLWKAADASIGSFAPGNAANSTFTCLAGSPMTGTDVTVTANNGECSKTLSATVSCVNQTCGNGVADPGEICDPSVPGTTGCLPNCTKPTCGDGIVQAPVEQCDPLPADLNNCTATCQIRPAECGDGFLETGEACDPSVAGTTGCNADCTTNTPPVCGDGKVTGTEICDPGFTKNNCGKDCMSITSTACFTCENDPSSCADFVSCDIAVGNAAAGSPAAGTPKSNLCNEVLDCARDSGCAVGAAPVACYCGTANATDCQSGLANGACRTQLERGLETTTPATIIQRLKNVSFGGGVAMARIDCDQTFCVGPCGL